MADRYECEDCGKPWNSLSAVMQCPCDRYDRHGYPRGDRYTEENR